MCLIWCRYTVHRQIKDKVNERVRGRERERESENERERERVRTREREREREIDREREVERTIIEIYRFTSTKQRHMKRLHLRRRACNFTKWTLKPLPWTLANGFPLCLRRVSMNYGSKSCRYMDYIWRDICNNKMDELYKRQLQDLAFRVRCKQLSSNAW